MPNINQSSWAADNLPLGVTFDSDAGVFSGTPVLVGEYDMPVTVTTEYGSDTKNVSIKISRVGAVLAKGLNAKAWGENSEDTPDGIFRVLPIPKAQKLDTLGYGFGAVTIDDEYYVCGMYGANKDFSSSTTSWKSTSVPLKLNSDIAQISSGAARLIQYQGVYTMTSGTSYSDTFSYFMERYKSGGACINILGRARTVQETSVGAPQVQSFDAQSINIDKCTALHENIGGVPAWYEGEGVGAYLRNNISSNDLNIVKAEGLILNGKVESTSNCYTQKPWLHYMELSGDDKMKVSFNSNYDPDVFGSAKDFWEIHFVLNENNELYATGTSTNGCLGLSPTGGTNGGAGYNTYVKVGDFDVKKIRKYGASTFLLTNDGKLYHAGVDRNITGDVEHDVFTPVFEDYKFIDIAYSAGTLIAIPEGF